MLHAKLQVHRTSGSRRFWEGLTINGRGGHLGHMTWTIYTNFTLPTVAPQKNLANDWPNSFGKENI